MTTQAKQYNRIKIVLSILHFLLGLAFLGVILFAGWSASLADWAAEWTANRYLQLLIFALILGAVGTILSLPLSYYSGYTLEHKFNLSHQSFGRWLVEELKGLAVSLVLAIPVLLGFYFFLVTFPNYWWLPLGILLAFLSIILARLAPILILPLFYKFIPIDHNDVKENLLDLCKRGGVPVLGIFSFNLSKNTRKANAGFTGWGRSRRIILGDTLLKNFSPDEITPVFAHELGHFKQGHLWKGMAAGTLSILFGLWLTSLLYRLTLPGLGFENQADIGALPLLALWLALFGLVTLPLNNGLSRRWERAADRYAVKLTEQKDSFLSSLEKLADLNLADRDPHPVVEFLFYGHPSIKKRMEMVKGV
ncbi:M48 family metallopeptidase [candidate division KSB1 bacterium]|nr:M48 family metallopeptidase [candidate division KSB1 bacterium]